MSTLDDVVSLYLSLLSATPLSVARRLERKREMLAATPPATRFVYMCEIVGLEALLARLRGDVHHPMQAVVRACDGVIRFRANAVVDHVYKMLAGMSPAVDYNALMAMPWSDDDRDQWNQLIGYSVSGIPMRSSERQRRADALAEEVIARERRETF